jgi:molecular chaperone GrpE (heat shock protein)
MAETKLEIEPAPVPQSDAQQGDGYAQIVKAVQDGNSQTMFMRQQVGQLFTAVSQLYDAVKAQCVQLRDSDAAVVHELQKFQTGGPQRVMAGVYAKLFRDLLKPMNELDDLVAVAANAKGAASGESWLHALQVTRDQFEKVLREWGCVPVEINIGQQEFDPEVHEAVVRTDPTPPSHSNCITAVRRRGWIFGTMLLQHPLVVVD